jgi:toxin ParE1/3/4
VKLIIQASAEDDMLRQYDWYEKQGLGTIADRFSAAVAAGIGEALKTPKAGAPRHVGNPALAGLRTWPVKGFDEFRIYYLFRRDVFMVVRVLHGKRDIGAILEKQAIDDPGVN